MRGTRICSVCKTIRLWRVTETNIFKSAAVSFRCLLPLLLFLAFSLSACGIGSATNSKKPEEVSEIATGSAITTVFSNSETSVKEKRFENDHIRIWQYYDEEERIDVSMQENLDGSGRKQMNINAYDLLWLTNDWLYYINYQDGGHVCRAPLMDGENDTFDTDKKEMLWKVDAERSYYFSQSHNFFVTDSYIFYGDRKSLDDEVEYYRYDFQTGESTPVFNLPADSNIVLDTDTGLPVTLEGTFFINCINDGIYNVSYDTLKENKIHMDVIDSHTGVSAVNEEIHMVEYEGSVYFSLEPFGYGAYDDYDPQVDCQIYQYDPDSTDVKCILSGDGFENIMQEMHLWDDGGKYNNGGIEGIYKYQDKLYMKVQLVWDMETEIAEGPQKGKKTPLSHNRQVLLSAGFSNLNHWKLEESLADYMSDHAVQNIYIPSDTKDEVYKTKPDSTLDVYGVIYNMMEGKVLIHLVSKENFSDNDVSKLEQPEGNYAYIDYDFLALYDIATGEVLQIDEKDWWYN